MAARYYDDLIAEKLKNWIPDKSKLRVLKTDETTRLFEMLADDSKDKPMKLPFIALSRSKDIELLSNIKQEKSFAGLSLASDETKTVMLNVIPIQLEYQLDIYTKTFNEGDEYVRQFLFKLINNPTIIVDIPYNNKLLQSDENDCCIQHIANLRVLSTVSDTSDISNHLFAGQFTRWSIQLELQDGFLFNIPYKNNWHLNTEGLEVSEKITEPGEIEPF